MISPLITIMPITETEIGITIDCDGNFSITIKIRSETPEQNKLTLPLI